MGTVVKGLFQNRWQPRLQLMRWKTKVMITRPRPPHFERALLESVCQPIFRNKKRLPYVPDFQSCAALIKKQKVEEEHPFKTLLANKSLSLFENSKMVAFFHLNSITPEEKFQCQLALKKNGMKLFFFSKTVLQKAISGTIYEAVLKLYDAPTATAFSPELNLHKLLSIVKKLPKMVLMGGIVDNRLLSLSELHEFGKFEDITQARLMLLSALNSAAQNIFSRINHHPSNFMELLNQHKKILEG